MGDLGACKERLQKAVNPAMSYLSYGAVYVSSRVVMGVFALIERGEKVEMGSLEMSKIGAIFSRLCNYRDIRFQISLLQLVKKS